jgi:hypothetical protein
MWGAHDGGFFDSEIAPFGEFRYTDGRAWIEVPAASLRDAKALKVDLFSYAKHGARSWVSIFIDGRPVWTGDVDPGISTLRVPLPGPSDADVARIEILSQIANPIDINPDDFRIGLSIGLIGMRPLHAGEPRPNGPSIHGFRSHLAPVALTFLPLQISPGHVTDLLLDVTNVGTEYWPTVRELGTAAKAIQVAIRWYRKGDDGAFVGDNRWSLAVSMLPGDRTRVRVPLVPIGLDGKALPTGDYEVKVGMVRETVALFADNGDAVLSIPILVSP